MMRWLCVALALAVPRLHAEDAFERRMTESQRWEDTVDGRAYMDVLYGAIGNDLAALMQRCFPKDGEHLDGFQFVADVNADRAVEAPAFRPDTPGVRCFAGGFPKLPFPALPEFAHGRLPVALKVRIEP